MIDAKEGNPRVAELKNKIKRLKKRINTAKEKESITASISVTNPLYLQTTQDLKQIEMEYRKESIE